MFGSGPSAFGASSSSFSFGNSKPAFGASTPAAFSFNSTPAFGSSTPAFGAASTPGFGATSAPAFGASPGGFGFGAATGASSSAFSFPTSTPAFGAASQPAFGQTPGFGASAPAFASSAPASGSSAPAFGASAPAFGAVVPFGTNVTQQPQQQGQQHQLFTKNGQPITDSTQWDDIHEDSQRTLLELEKVIVQCRQQQQQLNAGEHLQQSKQVKQDMEAQHQVLLHTLQVVGRVIKADSDNVQSFSERVGQLLRDTDTAVITFTRTKLWRELAQSHAQGQPIETAKRDMVLRLPIVLPSKFLTTAVQQFRETLQQYQELVQRLETVVESETGMEPAARGKGQAPEEPPLQIILQNAYRYLMAVAANLDRLHEAVADARQSFLTKRQEDGHFSNPFADADRVEQQKRKAEQQSQLAHAAPAQQQQQQLPPQQGQAQITATSAPQLGFGQSAPASSASGGLFSPMPAFGQQSAAATSNLFGSSQSGFGAPQSSPATANAFGAPGSGLFGTPQSSPAMFGTPSSITFGAAAPSPSGFGQSSLFGASSSTTFGKPAQSTTAKKNKGGRR